MPPLSAANPPSPSSLRAYRHLPGAMTFCSWQVGWRSLLLRAYDEPAAVEEFTTGCSTDHLIVLVTAGSCRIESRHAGGWHPATYKPGDLGMTPPGEVARLRWRGLERHATLQLHLPAATIAAVATEFRDGQLGAIRLPSQLVLDDPVIAEVMRAMARAAQAGVPDLYAATVAHYLAAHLLTRHPGGIDSPRGSLPTERLAEVDAFMRANLAASLDLATLAGVAGVGRFQFLRAAAATWRETPFRRLTRLRMAHAQHLLRRTDRPIITIAFDCGYSNPGHFATAFRRHLGMTPSAYRRG